MRSNCKNDWEQDDLKGNIKSIETIKQNFTYEKGSFIKKENYEQEARILTTYNRKGDQIQDLTYDSYNSPTFKLVWIYDAKGKKSGNKVFWGDGNLLYESKYLYEPNGDIIESVVGCKIIYKYNTTGWLIENIGLDTDGEIQNKRFLIYDEHDNLIEWQYKDDFSNSIITYTYDKFGNVIKESEYFYEMLNDVRRYEYEYDVNGNWIKKSEMYVEDGELLKSIYERKIEYYQK